MPQGKLSERQAEIVAANQRIAELSKRLAEAEDVAKWAADARCLDSTGIAALVRNANAFLTEKKDVQ